MPRRNEPLKAGKLYCIRQASNGKVYHLYSEQQLNRLIENGTVKPGDQVQISQSNSF